MASVVGALSFSLSGTQVLIQYSPDQCEQSAQESDDQESVGSETQRLSHNGDVNLTRDEGDSEVGEFDNGKWRYRSESLERRSVGSEMSLVLSTVRHSFPQNARALQSYQTNPDLDYAEM
ncbi:hypothetical protein DFH07DRAFT_779716 [Mycena maculata]|uniref:Uncharacterized protein n=1 Tax=Mycena maculata TaxID=230809 RepID=A0AAD7MXI5_9AGAR|nr:hypothetical protein DFH07DRAFT_779716 [Mycena maculata]